MKREEALELIKTQRETLVKHALAVEAIMRGIAESIDENEELFGLAGLLHDIDFEKTESNPKIHGIVAAEILSGKVSEDIIYAIKSHNFENTGVMPEEKIDYALICSDAVSGLLIACALVKPSKRIRDVDVKFVSKKFKQKDFARGSDRNAILYCEKLNISKEKLFEIGLSALKNIADKTGI